MEEEENYRQNNRQLHYNHHHHQQQQQQHTADVGHGWHAGRFASPDAATQATVERKDACLNANEDFLAQKTSGLRQAFLHGQVHVDRDRSDTDGACVAQEGQEGPPASLAWWVLTMIQPLSHNDPTPLSSTKTPPLDATPMMLVEATPVCVCLTTPMFDVRCSDP